MVLVVFALTGMSVLFIKEPLSDSGYRPARRWGLEDVYLLACSFTDLSDAAAFLCTA